MCYNPDIRYLRSEIMTNENMFSNCVSNYSKGRHGYAPGVIDLLCTKILKKNAKIADVGSGTGIFARELLNRGFDVFCIEPNEKMRLEAEQEFIGNVHFVSIAASAEDTTLSPNSIDLITAASAFHWFDTDKFCLESKRILKPDGILFTVANARNYTDEFTYHQHEICKKFCPNFTSLCHGLDKSIPLFEKIFGTDMHQQRFDFPLEYTKERFINRSLSSSYAPSPNTKEQREYVQELWDLMNTFAPDSDTIIVSNISVVYWGKLV